MNGYVIIRVYPGNCVDYPPVTHGIFPTYGAALRSFGRYTAECTGNLKTEGEFYGKDSNGNAIILILNQHTILPTWMFE